MGPPASIIFPTRRRRDYLAVALASVAGQAAASGAEIQQGFLETGNMSVADSAIRLVSVMRQFEMLQKATNLGSDMNRKAIEEVGRIGN